MSDASTSPEKVRGNIFVIDDDPEMVAILSRILSREGHRVESANDPLVALEKELPFRPDILLVDVMMPRISGIELIGKIRGTAAGQGMRIITVSALHGDDTVEKALEAGADDFLVKPFHPDELILRVSQQFQILREERSSGAEGLDLARGRRGARLGGRQSVRPRMVAETGAEIPPGPRTAPSGAKILVVDDDPEIRDLVKELLSAKGHAVLLASDGQQGISLAEREEPDLIVLDIRIPGPDGYAVSARLAEEPHTAFIPILMLSSQDNPKDIVHGLSGYADEYMTKPFQPEELVARVGALLRITQHASRTKRAQLWIIQNLAEQAQLRGRRVYSRHIPGAADRPGEWKGPLPDLIVQRGRRATAYMVESVESLHDERTVARWQALEELEGVRVILMGQSAETADLAKRIRREHGLSARIRWMRPCRPEKKSGWQKILTPRRLLYFAAGIVAVIFSLFVSGVFPNLWDLASRVNPRMQEQYRKYQPRDIERGILEDKKSLEKREREYEELLRPAPKESGETPLF